MNAMDIEQARFNMIEQQVRAWDVLDERVLQILRKVPRDQFTPEQQRFRAYADAFPESTILLVDTYDTLKSGLPNALTVARELREQGRRRGGAVVDRGSASDDGCRLVGSVLVGCRAAHRPVRSSASACPSRR